MLDSTRFTALFPPTSVPSLLSECLETNGWHPLVQFATHRYFDQENLENSLYACLFSLQKETAPIKHDDIYTTAEFLTSLKQENMPAYSRFDDCMRSNGWVLISAKPWLDVDERHLIIPPFATPDQEKLSPVARNETLAIYWAADIVEKGLLLTYSQAVEYISAMNEERHSGRSNWRLPTEDELRIIGKTLHSSRIFNHSSGNSAKSDWKQQGPFWSASKEAAENARAVKIPDGELTLLPNTAPFVAHLLPVSGNGWNSFRNDFTNELNNRFPESRSGQNSKSPAFIYQDTRFLRYSTSNLTPMPVAPLGR
jgi:hypothetical protein